MILAPQQTAEFREATRASKRYATPVSGPWSVPTIYESTLPRIIQPPLTSGAPPILLSPNFLHQIPSFLHHIRMALLNAEGPAALLRDCVGNKIKACDLIEALGLNNTNSGRASPKFDDADVTLLYKGITRAVNTITESPNQSETALRSALMNEENLSEEVDEICSVFGDKIWGRSKRSHLLKPSSNSRYLADLYFDREDDCKSIKLYLRCWIVKRGSRRIADEQRKLKEARRSLNNLGSSKKSPAQRVIDLSEESDPDNSIDSSEDDSLVHSPKVHPTPSKSSAAQTTIKSPLHLRTAEQTSTRDQSISGIRDAASRSVNENGDQEDDDLYAPPPKQGPVGTSSASESPGKRKRPDTFHRATRGKLPKGNMARRGGLASRRINTRDVFDMPQSPTEVFTAGPFRTTFGARRDASEAIVVRQEPYTAPNPESGGNTNRASNQHESLFGDARNPVTEIPANLNRSNLPTDLPPYPSTRDSVIPEASLPDAPEHENPSESIRTQENDIPEPRSATAVAERSSSLPAYADGREPQLRRELFKLLLARLSNLNQFCPDLDHRQAEERLDQLLYQFWYNDSGNLHKCHGDGFVRLHVAFESWMQMRASLDVFQRDTGYYSNPGEEWQGYLRSMSSIERRSQACIALMDLRDSVKDLGTFQRETLNGDLATVFDELTKVPDCTGVEAFGGIAAFNQRLLAWFP
ncbi:hypothetical protein BCR34DRAFT_574164 [Clohesyomyces aquaticus]|uniref:Uncharacterized protein n=1 Tax=Clohesyomyces aquaticus TaxID=1231657 RepID=A0A1Y1YWB0_9PLEO|nr:hypothetical protein BCR34DRAFT_574164 [Clohesyomyces aquaticus]